MKNLLEIKPSEGLGKITFGMSPKKVDEIINEEQVWENWMGGNRNDSLMYHGIIFMFDECNSSASLENSKLTDISIYNREDILLFGKLLKDWTEKDLLRYCLRYCEQKNILFYKESTSWINFFRLGFDVAFNDEDSSVCVDLFMLQVVDSFMLQEHDLPPTPPIHYNKFVV